MSHLWTASVLHGPSESLHQYPRRPGTLGRTLRPLRPLPPRFLSSVASPRHRSSPASHRGSSARSSPPRHAVARSPRPMTSCGTCPAWTSAPSKSNASSTRSARNASTNGTKPLSVSSSCPWPRSSPCPKALPPPEVAVVMTDGGRYQMRVPSRSADANPVGTVDAPASGAARLRTRRPPQLRKPPRTRRKKRRKRRTGVRIRSACC